MEYYIKKTEPAKHDKEWNNSMGIHCQTGGPVPKSKKCLGKILPGSISFDVLFDEGGVRHICKECGVDLVKGIYKKAEQTLVDMGVDIVSLSVLGKITLG